MPIKNDPSSVTRQINHALRNNVLSNREAKRLLRNIKKDGVTEEEVSAVVDTLKSALAGSPDSINLDTSTKSRKRVINRFLGALNQEQALPLDTSSAKPTGSVNWLQLMTQQSDAVALPLADKSFGGHEVGIDTNGGITLDAHRIDLSETPTAEMNEALWALNKPNQLDELDAKTLLALNENLLGNIEQNIETPNDAEGKFKKLVSTAAASGALANTAAHWDSETSSRVLDLIEKSPNPLTKALLLRGLENAELTPAQKNKFESIEKPEHNDALLEAYDGTCNERHRVAYNSVEGETAEFFLSALTFAKSPAAIENVEDGMKSWKGLNSSYNTPWDAEELGNMKKILETYVDKYPQTAYVYGTFSNEAPKRIAEVTNQRVIEALTPNLEAAKPSIDGFPLTSEQADFIKTLLPNIEDKSAAKGLVRSLIQADGAFQQWYPSSYGMPQVPEKPMSQAAFEMFKKAASAYQETAEGTKTGKLDYGDFRREFGEQTKALHDTIKPRMDGLRQTPPTWDGVQISPDAATFITNEIQTHTRSTMSIDNLGRAIHIFAKKNGGKLEGAALSQFKEMLTEYKANWPDAKTFDFNKLERIATYKVEGKEVPLCTINGQKVGLAQFYNKVGADVSQAIDPSKQRHAWMPERWGYRAKQSVELLDVVAEQTARGEGPVSYLKNKYPGKEIAIQATGRDGAHEQFLYVVKSGSREIGSFAQGSDGTLKAVHNRNNPVLFTASVGNDGELNVNIPDTIKVHRYPLQTTYDVGDKIDISYRDKSQSEGVEEGNAFFTQNKVLEAEITGYDPSGNYTVKFTNPEGKEETKTLSMRDIRRANNPHYFKAKSSYFSDVIINLNTDKELKSFLDEAQPIIDRYLPTDGSQATMSPKELAKRKKDCIKALMDYTSERVKYPEHEGAHMDDASQKYHDLTEGSYRFPLGDLVKIGRGVCRHQCILEQLLLQQAGIESRLASGAANTGTGKFRGYHIWTEVTLADNERYLSDQTWDDPMIPLWKGAYGTDKRRIEMYNRTARYDNQIEMPQ